MRNLLVCIFAILLFGNLTFAQEKKTEKPFSPKGSKALSFSFNGLNLGEFYGGVGGKIWISNSISLFASIDMDYSSNTIKKNNQVNGSINSNFSNALTVGMNKYLGNNKRFLPYFGFNLGFGFSKSTNEIDYVNDTKNISESGLFSLNLGGALGIESFVTESISIAAQHTLGLGFGIGSVKTTFKTPNLSDQVNERDQSQFNFGFGTSSLILSLYF